MWRVQSIGNNELQKDEANRDERAAEPVDPLVGRLHTVRRDKEERGDGDGKDESSESPQAGSPGMSELGSAITIAS